MKVAVAITCYLIEFTILGVVGQVLGVLALDSTLGVPWTR
jgi:hypothetical protein